MSITDKDPQEYPFADLYLRHLWVAVITLPVLYWFKLMVFLHKKLLPSWTAYINPLMWGFVLADVLYNVFVGTILFRELPREWVFTQRVQRHYNRGSNHAGLLAKILNNVDPNHIKTDGA